MTNASAQRYVVAKVLAHACPESATALVGAAYPKQRGVEKSCFGVTGRAWRRSCWRLPVDRGR
jgi:hypothetical protein